MPRIIVAIFWAVFMMACADNLVPADNPAEAVVERPEPAGPPDLDESAPQWVRETVLAIWQNGGRSYAFSGMAGWGTCAIPDQAGDCWWVAYNYYQFRFFPPSILPDSVEFGVDGESLDQSVELVEDELGLDLEVKEHLR